MDWLTIGVTCLELLCCFPQFIGSLLAYLTGHTLLLFLRLGRHRLAQVLVDFLLDVKILVKKLEVQRSDLFVLSVHQLQLVLLIHNVMHFHHCPCHFLFHSFTRYQVRLNFLVLIHHKSKCLIKVYLFCWGEALCCFELLATGTAQKPNECTFLWGIFKQSLQNICLDGSFSGKIFIVYLHICLFLVTFVFVYCNFNCASFFFVKHYLVVFFISDSLWNLNQSQTLKFTFVIFLLFPNFNKKSREIKNN